MFFQPVNRVFSNKINVFALQSWTSFGVLQSRVHVVWAWLNSSKRKADLAYTPSKCFDTFPFPWRQVDSEIEPLREASERLYGVRSKCMIDADAGLTKTYNKLKDPTCTDPEILHLRELHEELDRKVLEAYGWSDIEVPPYVTPTTDADRKALEAFEDKVIDRLFVLNAERAAEEERLGLRTRGKKGKKGRKRKASDKKDDGGQQSLL